MSIEKTVSDNNENITFKINGEFGNALLNELRETTGSLPSGLKELHFDLTETTYMDSDATRYLLSLKNPASDGGINLKMTVTSPQVKKTVTMMEIDKVFTLQ